MPAYFLPMGEVERSDSEAGGPGLLHAGIHVAFIVEDHPGDVVIFPQGVVEGAVADIVDGAVPGEDDDLGQHAVVAVLMGLVQVELGPQGRGRSGAEAVVARRIDSGVEGVDQLRDLVAARGVDGVNVEAVVQHVLDGPLVPVREDLDALIKGGDPLGVVAQGLGGEEGQQVDDPLAAARAQGVLARIELGKDKEHLVIEGHLPHVRGGADGVVPGPAFFRQEVLVFHLTLGRHLQGVGGADLGADAAALAGRGIGVDVQGEAFPGDALGRGLELLEVARRRVHRPVGDGGDHGRIRAGGGAQPAGDALGGVIDRQLGADVAQVPVAAGARRDDGQEAVPGDLLAFQGGFDHFLIEGLLVIGHQVHRLDGPQIVLFRQDHRQARGLGPLAEVLRQRRGVDRGGGVQGLGPGGLFGHMAGRLVHPVFQQGDVGLQHLLLLGPQLLLQDLLEALLEFPLRQDAGLLVDQAQDGGSRAGSCSGASGPPWCRPGS